MSLLRDAIYLLLAAITSPVWIVRMARTGKYRTDWQQRFGRGAPIESLSADGAARPRVLIHAVSVGEVNAAAQLVRELAQLPEQPQIVVAATTDTGFARANELFAGEHDVVRYPFDASFAVKRFLARVQPNVVVLIELEVWPNFTAACRRRGIPMLVVNGRLSERSFRRYRWIAPLVRSMFGSLHTAAVQSEAYAERFRELGTPETRVIVTDTMKWDTAQIADDVPGAAALAADLGIDRNQPLIVAGSTAPGEHELLAGVVPDDVQLLIAPRKPEWFDHAAGVFQGCARRSRSDRGSATGRFLLDTIGELRKAYALADLVIVGRTFVDFGGSDMIEPIALGKATIIGPHAANFEDTVRVLRDGDGLLQVEKDALAGAVCELLANHARRTELADNGRAVIRAHQGATARHVELIHAALVGGCMMRFPR